MRQFTVTDWTPVTVSATGVQSSYANAVINTSPTNYWPLGEADGTTGYDWTGGDDLTVTGATRGVAGQQLNSTATATSFAGQSTSYANNNTAQTGPQTFTVEAWFNTTSTSGGKIVGFEVRRRACRAVTTVTST